MAALSKATGTVPIVATLCVLLAVVALMSVLQGRTQAQGLYALQSQLQVAQRESKLSNEARLAQWKLLQDKVNWPSLPAYAPAAWLSQLHHAVLDQQGISGFTATVFKRQLRSELLSAEREIVSVPIEFEFQASTIELALSALQDLEKSLGRYVSLTYLSVEQQTRGSVLKGQRLRCRLLHYAQREVQQP